MIRDLQLYDWVLNGNVPIQADAITPTSAWHQGGCFEPKPIILTEEILKANGFEDHIDDYGNPSLRLKGTDKSDDVDGFCFIDWTPKGTCCRNRQFDGFLYILMNIGSIHRPCHYVHELQHALRLCGLNDLADNFKIV